MAVVDLDVGILGSLEVVVAGRRVGIPAGKQRSLLVLLTLRAPQPVSAEVVAEALWPDASPQQALRSLPVTVSRLRRSLGDAAPALETVAAGYRFAIPPVACDFARFERLVHQGTWALARSDAAEALAALEEALALWRGPALADVAYEGFAQAEIRRLEELRGAAVEARVDAAMALGREATLVGELQAMVATNPTRERLAEQLMTVLYRTGRQAEALEVYRHIRSHLSGELGLEPGPRLKALQAAIFDQSPALSTSTPVTAAGSTPPADGDRGATAADSLATGEKEVPPGLPRGPTPIPLPPTRTVGREEHVEHLRRVLLEPVTRLVTVVGPAGVGKTRLAQEAGRLIEETRAGGGAYASLAQVAGPEQVPDAIARALDVVPVPGVPVDETVVRDLATRELLLVLDNFEHVLDAAPFAARIIAAAPSVTILATSREPLRIRGERRFTVEPLDCPSAGAHPTADAGDSAAVALFVQTVSSRVPTFAPSDDDFAAIGRLCHRLDGLPLAIELAAGRVGLLSPAAIEERVSDDLDVLGRGPRDAPLHQRTLTATLAWSFDLLTAQEQSAFACMSVFAGGCWLEAAEEVTDTTLDALESLVDKHLLRLSRVRDGSRLGMLETARGFARERLAEQGHADAVRERHAGHYLRVVEDIAAQLRRGASDRAIERLEPEIDNVRAALTWALERPAPEIALRLAAAFDRYLRLRDPREGEHWVDAALRLPADDVAPALRARALNCRGYVLNSRARFDEARAAAGQALELLEGVDDPSVQAESRLILTYAAAYLGTSEEAVTAIADSAVTWARRTGEDDMVAAALVGRFVAAPTLASGMPDAREADELLTRVGDHPELVMLLAAVAYRALAEGDFGLAERSLRRARRVGEAAGRSGTVRLAQVSGNEGLLALLRGDLQGGAGAFCDELVHARRHGLAAHLFEGLGGVAALLAAAGDDVTAARLLGAGEARSAERHHPGVQRELDRVFAGARARLGPDRWQREYEKGFAMDEDEAVELALGAARTVTSRP